MTYYSRPIKMPATKHEGLCNFVQMIINKIEAGDPQEALLIAADLHDTLSGSSNPFASITADRDNKLIEEIKKQHASDTARAMEAAYARGVEDGERVQKQRIAELLGIAA